MPFAARVYQVLIASPSDVADERAIVRDQLHEWNARHSKTSGVVLLPVTWETHATPEMGERPQAIINRQLVDSCDALLGIFWTRIGTPTGVAESGSVEEIQRFIEARKNTMLYFCTRPVAPDNLDGAQWERLRGFREWCKTHGLIEKFESLDEFRLKLSRHLESLVQRLAGIKPSPMVMVPPGGKQYQVLTMVTDNQAGWDYIRAGP